jgi:hypothetical protein
MSPIRVCKNRESGKYFIHIADAGPDKFTLVTPQGKVKILEKRFFEEPTTEDDGTITELQHKVCQEYKERRMEDLDNFLKRTTAEMSPKRGGRP